MASHNSAINTYIDTLAELAEQCETAGRIDASNAIDKAIALLDPTSFFAESSLTSLIDSLYENYTHQIGEEKPVKIGVEAIVNQVNASVNEAILHLDKLKNFLGPENKNAVYNAAKLQALAILIGIAEDA